MVAGVAGVGALLAWLVNTFFSFVLGLIIGGIVAVIVHFLPFGHHGGGEDHGTDEGTGHVDAEAPTSR